MTPNINRTQVLTAVRTFLLGIVPSGVEVVRAQQNQASFPVGECVYMTIVGMERLNTNVHKYTDTGTNPGTNAVMASYRYTVQLDFYGEHAQDNAIATATLFRDEYGVKAFPSNIAPLYTDEPSQMPLVTGEENYLERWKLELSLQINPETVVPQDYADELEIGTAGHPVNANTTKPLAWNGLIDIDQR